MSRPMKDSGIAWIGQVPEHWEQALIGSLYKLRNTKVSDKQFEPLSVTMRGILHQLENAAKTNDGDNRKLVKQGDFVINSRSDRRGACGISKYDGSVSLINLVLVPQNHMNPGYYNWLFHTSAFADEFYKWGHGIVDDLWTTRWQDMKNITIPLPSLREQQRIAEYLDKKCAEIDTLSNSIQQQIDTLEQYKRAVITETVTKGFHPSVPMKDSGIPWIGKIPQHWSTLPLRYWMLSRQSGAWGENEQQNQDDHPCVRVADFDYDTYQLKDNTPTTLRNYTQQTVNLLALKKNDILIEKSGGGEKTPVGRSIIIRKDFDSPILFANFVERIRIKPMYCAMYVEYALVAFYKQGSSTFYFQQTTGIQNLNITKMFRMESIPCPSLHEQQAIADYLDKKCAKIDGIIHVKQQQLEELEQYKKAIIFEYVTGKKQVPEA